MLAKVVNTINDTVTNTMKPAQICKKMSHRKDKTTAKAAQLVRGRVILNMHSHQREERKKKERGLTSA